MRSPRRVWLAQAGWAAAGVSTLCFGGSAHAQLLDRYFPANVPAYQDWAESASGPPSDLGYAPIGIKLGSFIVYPMVAETLGYATNPYGTAKGNGSTLEKTDAAITANSNWSRNSLNAYLSTTNTQYLNLGQSLTDWTASLGSTIQVADNMLELGYVHIYAVTLPTAFGAFAESRPITDQNDDFRASYKFGSGRVSLEPALQGDLYRFASAQGEGNADSEALSDRDALTASLTANYQFAGGHNLLVILSDSIVQYEGKSSPRPANYDDFSALVGIEYRSSAVLSYRALVGYEDRNATGHGTTDGSLGAPEAELDVLWNPTALTSVTGKVSQSFQNEPTDGGQAISETSVQLVVAHSLTRAVEIDGSAHYLRGSFPQGGGGEQGILTTLRASWHLARHVVLSSEYDFTEQSGDNVGSLSYRDHQIVVRGQLQW